MSIRRKAFAIEASTPIREKVASYGSFLWNWTLRFLMDSQHMHDRAVVGQSYISELVETPGVVLADVVVGEVVRSDIGDGFGVDSYYLAGV